MVTWSTTMPTPSRTSVESGARSSIRVRGGAVVQMEQHDQAYHAWRAAGVHRRVLVHVDAHHDMWWFGQAGSMTIANFVCQALREDRVDRMFWVVPDPTWRSAAGRRAVRRHLDRLRQTYGAAGSVDTGDTSVATDLLGCRVSVCPLSALPRIDEPVLLDVDVDYFLIPMVAFGGCDAVAQMPWRWPDEVLADLQARGIRSDLITIAYSVDGGYTPIAWKHLGDELAARLGETVAPVVGFDDIRAGALAAARDDYTTAIGALTRAAAQLPGSAAPLYHLAGCLRASERIEAARDVYRRALALDPTYDTPYDEGMSHYRDRRDDDASAAWRSVLLLNPASPYAHVGLARVAARYGRWDDAAAHALDALAARDDLVDAYRVLGRACAAQKRYDDAIVAYERSLTWSRGGRRSVAAMPAYSTEGRLVDPDYFAVFARLGRLYAARGDARRAIEDYRMAMAGGSDGLSMRLDLARIYARQGQLGRGLREIGAALRLLSVDGWRRVRRARARIARRRSSVGAAA
jgi:tetratricopeptide (TPR) repeat protein